MGGKKKSLANKLAKMTDEERARYLQHKAEMEEEARRRKEQLIATFLKRKIKREEMFSRLNLAKINQHWHQILRKSKCQEMKENVLHMKNWIERVLEYKNRTISKLMEELEEAEEQYSNNFQSHSIYIDNIIENQHQCIEKMQQEYSEDVNRLLKFNSVEMETLIKNAKNEEQYLQSVLYGQENGGNEELKSKYEYYKQKEYETEMNINGKLGHLMESCGKVSDAIWSQIATVVKQYVQRTDPNRIHLEDMRRSDAESAAEITDNEGRIRKKRKDHDNLCLNRGKKIKVLEKELGVIKVEVIKSKQQLKRQLQIDEKKLKHISNCSSQSQQYLETMRNRGEQIKNLANICERFQTQREITAKWLPLISNVYLKDNVTDQTDLRELQAVIDSSDVAKDIELSMLEKPKTDVKGRTRPKTSVPGRPSKPGKTVSQTSTPDSKKITKLRKVHLEEKDSSEKAPLSSVPTLSTTASPDIIDRCLESLRGMENFWFTFNKVEVDYMEIKEEKKLLENENKQLKGLARAVLESASLAESIPNRSVSSKSRMAKSAPIRRVVRALF